MLDEENFRWKNVWNQYFATFAVNLITITQGCIIGWVSPALPILASSETPLDSGPLTNDEVSWIGSVDYLGALPGSLVFGYFITSMGCKRALLYLVAPMTIVFWMFIYFGNSFYYIVFAKLINGLANGGIISATMIFISEISNDDIRGRLCSCVFCSRNIGTFIGYILGLIFEYKVVPWISCLLPVVFVISLVLIPNTPQYYLQRGQIQEAEQALKFYKGYKGHSQAEEKAFKKEFDRLKTFMSDQKKNDDFKLADFCTRSAMKGLAIGIALAVISQFTACFTIVNYAVITFAKAGKSVDPYMSMIVLGVALMLGAIASACFADKIGRKLLILVSVMGSACGLLITALYHYLNLLGYNLSAFSWLPVISLSFMVFISSVGIIPLCSVCTIEYLPGKIRAHGVGVVFGFLSLACFASLKIYPILLETLDLHVCLSIFGIASLFGFVFLLIVLKETKGTSLNEVGVDEQTTSL